MNYSPQVASEIVQRWQGRIDSVESDITAIMKDESLEKRLRQVCCVVDIDKRWSTVVSACVVLG